MVGWGGLKSLKLARNPYRVVLHFPGIDKSIIIAHSSGL